MIVSWIKDADDGRAQISGQGCDAQHHGRCLASSQGFPRLRLPASSLPSRPVGQALACNRLSHSLLQEGHGRAEPSLAHHQHGEVAWTKSVPISCCLCPNALGISTSQMHASGKAGLFGTTWAWAWVSSNRVRVKDRTGTEREVTQSSGRGCSSMLSDMPNMEIRKTRHLSLWYLRLFLFFPLNQS